MKYQVMPTQNISKTKVEGVKGIHYLTRKKPKADLQNWLQYNKHITNNLHKYQT